jgi:hypothetical protein
MPFPKQPKHDFTVSVISKVTPKQPGIYGIFNHSCCIYIAQAEDIRESLLKHANNESSDSAWIFERDPQYWQAAIVHESQLSFWEKILSREFKPLTRTSII